MNAVSLNNLWNYISGLSLTAQNKRWLSDKLIESTTTSNKKNLSDAEVEKLIDEIGGAWAGESFPDADELYAMRKTKHHYDSL